MSADAARHLSSPPQPIAGFSSSGTAAESAPALLYTIAEAAALLHVPEGWLRKKVSAGSVPHTRLGKHVRFTMEHLRRIVVEGEVAPAPTPPGAGQGVSPRARRRPGRTA